MLSVGAFSCVQWSVNFPSLGVQWWNPLGKAAGSYHTVKYCSPWFERQTCTQHTQGWNQICLLLLCSSGSYPLSDPLQLESGLQTATCFFSALTFLFLLQKKLKWASVWIRNVELVEFSCLPHVVSRYADRFSFTYPDFKISVVKTSAATTKQRGWIEFVLLRKTENMFFPKATNWWELNSWRVQNATCWLCVCSLSLSNSFNQMSRVQFKIQESDLNWKQYFIWPNVLMSLQFIDWFSITTS